MQCLNKCKDKLKKQDWKVDNEYRFPISGFGNSNERSVDRDKDCGRSDKDKK
jgi:hypothetical protein